MDHVYLVRYGQAGAVGRYRADAPYPRGAQVVVRSHRGLELGEVLTAVPAEPSSEATDDAHVQAEAEAEAKAKATCIVRSATEADRDRARRADRDRAACFEACARVLSEAARAPEIDLIDVELLLDDQRAVLHYLGPHHLPALADWRTAFHTRLNLDVRFEAAGLDLEDDAEPEPEADPATGGCDHCGSPTSGCGTGGCGSTGGGCSDCGVLKTLAAARASR